jgi:hypothetical protein
MPTKEWQFEDPVCNLYYSDIIYSLYICGNLPQCKTDNSHRVAKAGDICTLQIVEYPHKRYPTSANS